MKLLAGYRGAAPQHSNAERVWGMLARQHPTRGAGDKARVVTLDSFSFGAGGNAALAQGGPNDRFILAADARLDAKPTLYAQLGLPDDTNDAGLILAAWMRWGDRAPERLFGDYAFAVWDRVEQRLSMVRDALGQCPLFFRRDGSAFGSRADAFSELDPDHARPCGDALAAHLAFAVDGTSSFYRGVERVRPGELVTIAGGRVERRRWWQPSLRPEAGLNARDWVSACRALLETAVSDRVSSAGVVATHLSAGLDSGVATALAAGHFRDDAPVHAFTAIPASVAAGEQRLVDEGAMAAIAAAALPAVRHHRVAASGDPLAWLGEAARLYQKPLPNPHNHGWVAAINDAARDVGADLLLIGQTGNYSFSMAVDPRRRLKRVAKAVLAPFHRPASSFPLLAADALALTRADPAPADGPARRLHFLRRLDPGAFFTGIEAEWGLAVRDPFADRRLVEFSLTVPDRTLAALSDRGLGRPVAAALLPAAFVANRARGYQSADWIDRLRHHAGTVSALIARTRDHDVLWRLLDLDAVAAAAARLESLAAPTISDQRLYRVELPRALAVMAFVDALESPMSHAEPPAWQGARL